MKRTSIYLLTLMIFAFTGCGEGEQRTDRDNENDQTRTEQNDERTELRFPRLSPRAEVMQTIGITPVTINYSRPYVRERVIWGDLVPYEEEWRTGADAPTTIKFKKDAVIEGQELPKGKYVIRTIPRDDDDWTFIFRDEDDNDINVDVAASSTDKHHEMMTFLFNDVTNESANVELRWEKLKTGFEITFDTDGMVAEMIKRAMDEADEDDWEVYSRSAAYYIRENKDLDQAEEWLDKAMEIEENWRNAFNYAQLSEARGDIESAVEWLERAIEIGREQEDEFPQADFLNSRIEGLQEDI